MRFSKDIQDFSKNKINKEDLKQQKPEGILPELLTYRKERTNSTSTSTKSLRILNDIRVNSQYLKVNFR